MKNISTESLKNLKSELESLELQINNSIKWSEDNIDLNIDRQDLLLLKQNRMNINRIKKSISSKPVFALFGASQVGKSYLIKNLLSIDGKPLEIKIGNEYYDFLEKINPAGSGAESTGVVTRFSIFCESESNINLIKAKLISISDLIIILTDCYINDTDLNDQITFENFEHHLTVLEERFKENDLKQNYLDENNIFEIRDHFNTNIKKSNLKHILESSNFWSRIGNLIEKIPSERWIEIFSLFWDNNIELNKLFELLNSNLLKLNYEESIFLDHKSILRSHGGILDVTRVKEIFEENQSEQKVYLNDKKLSVNTNILSALISEITLFIPKEIQNHKEFIKNTDLLDFPGARSRLELKNITIEETPLMFLRGKISYLFKKYSSNLAINNLLFCTKDEQIDVVELSSILNEWININIGDTPEHRSNAMANLNSNPLFIIFTFFNNQLKFDSTNDELDLNYKWENRFIRFFKEGIVSSNYDWDTNWTSEQQTFKNFYLVRDFKYSNDTFEGFDSKGTEKLLNPKREKYLHRLKKSFIDHNFVKNHFVNAEKSWDAASTINSDGTQLIIEKLAPSANNLVKTTNSIKRSLEIQKDTLACLDKYYISENKDQEREKVKKNCLNIFLGLTKFIGNRPEKFIQFISHLQVSEVMIYNIFHENINKENNFTDFSSKQLILNMYPYLSDNNTFEENIEIIRLQEGLNETKDVIEILESNNIDLKQFKKTTYENELNLIINKIFNYWENKVKDNSLNINKNLLDQILTEIKKLIEIEKLSQKIHDELSPKFNRVKVNREDEIYFASITTSLINEFINSFGTKKYNQSTTEKIINLLSTRESELYQKLVNGKLNQTEFELNKIFSENFSDVKNNFQNYLLNFEEWKLRMKIALINSCGYISNEKNNKAIRELIDSITNIKVEVVNE